jgi:tetratricopeptide (TPR) repeat protein
MTPVTSLAFGPLLKRARRAARLTQAELAERAGFSVVYVSMLERGARAPQRTTLALLADALDLSSDERVAFEAAAQAPDMARRQRSADPVGTAHPPVGVYLGALTAVAGGQGRILLLVGEPGVGKTRLAQQIALMAPARGFCVFTGRCYEPQQRVAYYPFLEALAEAASLAQGSLLTSVAERWPEVARLLPDQAAMAPAPIQVDDGNAQQRLFWQVSELLGTLSERAPVAVLLDDLHWADRASLDLLQHLTRRLRERPILLLGTAREVEAQHQHPLLEALSDLRREELLEQITVRPLAADETSALIGAALGGTDGAAGEAPIVAPELAARIYARSEGNAFFIRQLAKALNEQDELQFVGGQWRLSATNASASVSLVETPESIRAVIGLRLARLTPLTQDVLREASVLGQLFVFGELQDMSHRDEREVEEALEEATRAGIVREGARDRYHFNHALTRDTLYAELSARKKRRFHRSAADTIERMPDHERRAAELSYHLRAAGEGERALPYALLAGDQAETVYAHSEAEHHYRAVLALAQELADTAREAETLERLGPVVGVQGRYDEALELLERALANYQSLQDQSGELRALAALLEIQSEFGSEMLETAVARAKAILARLEPPEGSMLKPARASELAAVYRALAIVHYAGRREEVLAAASRATELARLAGDERQLVMAQHRLYVAGRNLDVNVAAWEDQLALARRTGQTKFVVFAHNMIGQTHSKNGEFARALPHMEQSLAVAEQRGDPTFLAWQLNNFTDFLMLFGDWPRARATYARAETLMREVDPRGVTWHAAGISTWPGKFALLEGRDEEGRQLLEQAIGRIEQVGTAVILTYAVCPLAEADVLAGRTEHAHLRLAALLQNPAIYESDALDARLLLAWAEGTLGRLAQAETRLAAVLASAPARVRSDALRVQGLLAIMKGDWDAAAEALNEALERVRAMPYPYAEAKALFVYGQLDAAKGDLERARERYQQAFLICERLGEGLYRKYIERDLWRLAQKR